MPTDDEILKAANRFFSKVGSAVKQAGSSAKQAAQQVTGVGRGSVKVVADRLKLAPGDDAHGKVVLDLAEPVSARKLIVTLRASQRTVDYGRTGGVRTVGTSKATIYELERELGGNRAYGREELAFTLTIPKEAPGGKPPAPAGKLGDVARAVSSVVAPTTGPIEWRITATLVIPWGRDLDHTIDLVVV